jgi:hypothetical protein
LYEHTCRIYRAWEYGKPHGLTPIEAGYSLTVHDINQKVLKTFEGMGIKAPPGGLDLPEVENCIFL